MREDFGQSAPKGGIVLCVGLSPRIYESLKTLCCMASAAGPLQAHEIASATGLPPAQTAKILQMMAWAGFVESRRGTKGGFWLVQPADRIRVSDVTGFFAHRVRGRRLQENGLLRALEPAMARCQKEFSRITVGDLAKASGCAPARPVRKGTTASAPGRRKTETHEGAAQKRSGI